MKTPSAVLTALTLPLLTLAAFAAADADALYRAGLEAENQRDFRAALANYEAALKIDAGHEEASVRSAEIERLVLWQSGIEGDPSATDIVRLGELLGELERYDDERTAYADAIALDDSCSEAHGHLAMANFRAPGGDFKLAATETIRFLETSPHRERLTHELSDFNTHGMLEVFGHMRSKEIAKYQTLLMQGRHEEAVSFCEEVAEMGPDSYRTLLYTLTGGHLASLGKTARARTFFGRALQHAKCNYTMLCHLALARMDAGEGKADHALENLRGAVAEGSQACLAISRSKADFRILFESEDPEVREEAERLADPVAGDAPLRAGIDAAVARAKKEGKKVLLEWYAPFSPVGAALAERLAHPEVRDRIAESFVHYRVNLGTGHRAVGLDREYGQVSKTVGFPCFLVLNADGSRHSAQKPSDLWGAPERCFDAKKIAAWLKETAGS